MAEEEAAEDARIQREIEEAEAAAAAAATHAESFRKRAKEAAAAAFERMTQLLAQVKLFRLPNRAFCCC